MPLTIIKGPPNSGRTELVRQRFEARLKDHPVLVVPSTDDIFGWERRLTRESGAFVGGKVVHFKDLVDEIVGDEATDHGQGTQGRIATPLRRRSLAVGAIRQAWPAIAVHLRDQPGLIDAALKTIDEFRECGIKPGDLDDPEKAAIVGPVADVYRRYLADLESAGLTDLPARAELASTRSLEDWQGRPVFLAGFDDLTPRQLELVRRLAAQTDVTVAMTHERGNEAMAVTEGLLGMLREIGGEVEKETSRPATPPDHDRLLVELERGFLDHSRDGTLEPGEALTLIEASGRRGEAEAIGAEIAGLVDRGVDPGDIAIALDAPAKSGGPLVEVLTEYGIPVTLEAETMAPETATGQAVINLLRAGSPTGSSAEFFVLLRGPLDLDQKTVDRIEFEAVRKNIESAAAARALAGNRLRIPGWDALKSGEPEQAVVEVASLAAAKLVAARPEALPDGAVATETQMATAIIRATREMAEIEGDSLNAGHLIDALRSGAVKTWAIPTAHTVQISSPYSLRAKRARYVFIASLQERDLGPDEGSPLMSTRARSALGIPDRTDQELQELYLFYSCLAVPTEALWLSHRVADVHGKAEFPSAMIGEVTRLFRDGGSGIRTVSRTGSDIIFPPAGAPSPHEWALTEASLDTGQLPVRSLGPAATKVSRARQTAALTDEFRNIDSTAALEGLSEMAMFSATALEAFIECPYKWFFERALSPVRFGPDPEAMAKGNLIHQVLAGLYEERPGEIPQAGDVDEWIARMEALVAELAPGCDLGEDIAAHRIQRRQVTTELSRFLRRESARGQTGFRPTGLESKFGFDEEGSKPALELDGWRLRGVIDRIDSDQDGHGVVFDYKSGASSYKTLAEIKREGKLQLLLYLKALEELWGLSPAAGLYVPVFAAQSKPRGIVDAAMAAALGDLGLVSGDSTADLDEEISEGIRIAGEAARKILSGEIAHDPSECLNHYAHAGVPDWNPEAEAKGEK